MGHLSRIPTKKSTPCRIRTCDLVLRRHPLWSTELRGRSTADYKDGTSFEQHDRSQDEGATEILDRIGPFPKNDHREQDAARRVSSGAGRGPRWGQPPS